MSFGGKIIEPSVIERNLAEDYDDDNDYDDDDYDDDEEHGLVKSQKRSKDSGISGSSESTPQRLSNHRGSTLDLVEVDPLDLKASQIESPQNLEISKVRKKRKVYRRKSRKRDAAFTISTDDEDDYSGHVRRGQSLPLLYNRREEEGEYGRGGITTPKLSASADGSVSINTSGLRRSLSSGVLIPRKNATLFGEMIKTFPTSRPATIAPSSAVVSTPTFKKRKKKEEVKTARICNDKLPKKTHKEKKIPTKINKATAFSNNMNGNNKTNKEITKEHKAHYSANTKDKSVNQITTKQRNPSHSPPPPPSSSSPPPPSYQLNKRRSSRPMFAKSYILSRNRRDYDSPPKNQNYTDNFKDVHNVDGTTPNKQYNYELLVHKKGSEKKNDEQQQSNKTMKKKSKLFRESPGIVAAKRALNRWHIKTFKPSKKSITPSMGQGSLKEYSEYVKSGGHVPQPILDPEKGVEYGVYALSGQPDLPVVKTPQSISQVSSQLEDITNKIKDMKRPSLIIGDQEENIILPHISGSVTPSVALDWSVTPSNNNTMTNASPSETMFNLQEALTALKKEEQSTIMATPAALYAEMESSKEEEEEKEEVILPPATSGHDLLGDMFGITDDNERDRLNEIDTTRASSTASSYYMTGLNSLDLFIDPLQMFGSDRHPALKQVLQQMSKTRAERAKQIEEERRKAAEKLEEEKQLAAELMSVRESLVRLQSQRRDGELKREALLNKAKELQTRAQKHKEKMEEEKAKLAVLWAEKLKEEREKTAPLEEVCDALREELDAENRRRMEAFDMKMKPILIKDGPSRKANYKIAAAKLHYEIYELTIRLRHTTMRAEQEEQIREVCEAEVKRLRDEISEKKLAITTVTKGIPFNKIEVRPEDQQPHVTDPYVLLRHYHKFHPIMMAAAAAAATTSSSTTNQQVDKPSKKRVTEMV